MGVILCLARFLQRQTMLRLAILIAWHRPHFGREARNGNNGQFCPGMPFFGHFWAAANKGVTNGGLRGVWPPFPGIGRNRPFSPFFCLFGPFPEGTKSTWEIKKTEEKGLFPQISSDLLKPPSLKPPFAALQIFPAGPKSIFRPFFPASGRRPEIGSVPSNQDPKQCRTYI